MNRLQLYSFSNTSPEEFITKMKEDIAELNETAFGSSLLHLIGKIYWDESCKQLQSPLNPSIISLKLSSTVQSYQELAQFLWSGVAFGRSAMVFMELNNELNDKVQRITVELEQELEISQSNGGGGSGPSVSSVHESVRDATSEDRKHLDEVLMGGLKKR